MSTEGEKILIIIPAFNEEKNIQIVIDEIHASLPNCDILVINDRSTDNTSVVAKNTGKAKVIDLPCNLGIGGAVQTGFIYAEKNNYDYAVQVDGDGQHIAEEVNILINKMKESNCDMVIGSRFLDKQSFRTTRIRRAGIKIFSMLYKLLIRRKITDGTSGFRAYNKRSISFLAMHYPDDYPEPEAIIMLKKNGFEICEVGVKMRERIHGKSSITPMKSLYYMVKVILSMIFSYVRN